MFPQTCDADSRAAAQRGEGACTGGMGYNAVVLDVLSNIFAASRTIHTELGRDAFSHLDWVATGIDAACAWTLVRAVQFARVICL